MSQNTVDPSIKAPALVPIPMQEPAQHLPPKQPTPQRMLELVENVGRFHASPAGVALGENTLLPLGDLEPAPVSVWLSDLKPEDQKAFLKAVDTLQKSIDGSDPTAFKTLDAAPGDAAPGGHPKAPPANVQKGYNDALSLLLRANPGMSYDDAMKRLFIAGTSPYEQRLTEFARAMAVKQKLQKLLRSGVVQLRRALDEWPEGQSKQTFTWTDLDENGQPQEHTQELTRDQARDLLEKLNGQAETLQSMDQQDALVLQSLVEGLTRAYNALSAVSKAEHDTNKVMVNNLRA